jgi:cysteine-rich repeat protein
LCASRAATARHSTPPCSLYPFCQLARCGDGIVDIAAGEQCDDGNNTSGDGCSASCRLE